MTRTDEPILVLGATGYVGGRLVPLLLERGWRVRAFAAAYMFVALNATTAMASMDALRGRYRVRWQKVV